MPTSDRLRASALVLLAGLALAGCDPTLTGLAGPAATRTKVDVAGRPVVIAAPSGFCVDPKSTAVGANGAFVLMSDCTLLGARASKRPPVGAALTASVSPGGLGGEGDDATSSLDDLQDFARTREGRALLGRSGQPDRVRILSTQVSGDVLYILVEDRGRLPIPGIDRQFWRAFMEVNGRMTALSVLGFEGADIGPQEALNQLAALAAAIRAANPSA